MSHLDLLLASASPRRRELMRLLNTPYDVCSADVDETPRPGETAPAMVERLSRAKAEAAHAEQPNKTVIACDTTVELDGAILGKPRDADEARTMLHALRGRDHSVYGGITIINPSQPPSSPLRSEPLGPSGSEGDLRLAKGGSEDVTLVVHTRVWMRD